MINFDEIAIRAYKNDPMPEYPSQPEQLAYLSMRALYNDFRKGNVDKDQAQQERNQIKCAYEDAIKQEKTDMADRRRLDDLRVKLATVSKEMVLSSSPLCKRAIKIIDNRN